jgi:DNA polymerase-1
MAAQLPAPGSDDVLYIVDLSGYVFRAYHAIAPLTNSKGEATHAVMGTANMLQRIVAARKPARIAVAMDSRTGSFRKTIDERYKANRPPAPIDLKEQMVRCEQLVRAWGMPVFQADGFEADDLVAGLTRDAIAAGMRVVVASADKDLMQLVRDDDDRVLLWDTMRDKVYGAEEVTEKFGVKPSALGDLLALTGDSSDNVPGVPSVGPKTAADLLTAYGTLDGVYANLAAIKRAKLKEALQNHEADARLSRTLVTLTPPEMPAFTPESVAFKALPTRAEGDDDPRIDALRTLFEELEFTRLAETFGGRGTAPKGKGVPGPPSTGARASASEQEIEKAHIPALVTTREALDSFVSGATAQEVVGLSAVVSSPATSGGVIEAAIIGLGLATRSGAIYVPIAHRYLGVPPQLSLAVVGEALRPWIGPGRMISAFSAKDVLSVLAPAGVLPADVRLFDPELAGYLLDPETAHDAITLARRELGREIPSSGDGDDGAKKKGKSAFVPRDQRDVEGTAAYAGALADAARVLHTRFAARMADEGLADVHDRVEAPLLGVLSRLERNGVLVDVPKLGEVSKRLDARLRALETDAAERFGNAAALRSRDQLETFLFDTLKLPVLKKTPKGGRSTDAEVLEELADAHASASNSAPSPASRTDASVREAGDGAEVSTSAFPKLVLEYRELDKLKGTYLDALPRYVSARDGRIHGRFLQTVAATGRLSSTDPNLQNIPIRTDVGKEIREAFIARPGFVVLSADYSQIELRVLAHLSQDPELLRAYRERDDIHAVTASAVFEVARDAVTGDMRRQAKTINFGVIYGMGEAALARNLGIEKKRAGQFIAAYFERYAGVRTFMNATLEAARKGEAVRTILGRRRFLPNLHAGNRGLRFEAERIAKNTPIQGTAADILKLAMVAVDADAEVRQLGAQMVLTVHDELVFEVPEANATAAAARIQTLMQEALVLSVPLDVNVGSGPNWALAH